MKKTAEDWLRCWLEEAIELALPLSKEVPAVTPERTSGLTKEARPVNFVQILSVEISKPIAGAPKTLKKCWH